VIRLENVTKRYGDDFAVKDLNLEVPEGELCCLIGPSGCGKSTTLKTVNAMIRPTSGRILVQDEDVTGQPPEKLRRRMGYVIQSIGLFPHMTVAQNVGVVPGLLGWDKSRTRKRALELLGLLGLDPGGYGDKYPKELSGGEAQRVGVARALAADPEILLMDEPFGALDPITRDKLQTEFARLQRELKKTILFVTHDIDEAIRLGSRIALMREGELVQHDTPETMLTRPANRFVRQFIGSDRALKRLSRLLVADHMHQAQRVRVDGPLQAATDYFAAEPEAHSVWVVSAEGTLLGWVDRPEDGMTGSVRENMVEGANREMSVTPEASLKQAVSALIAGGVECLPVVDERFRLQGEILLTDIVSLRGKR
jgi:osmoprotectant transport system ATP-binding protein